MDELNRRDVLGTLVTAGAGLMLSGIARAADREEASDAASDSVVMGAFAGGHAPKPLPYGFGKLKGLSERLVKSHWENNYSGAVKALNAVETKLTALIKDKDFSPGFYAALKREQLVKAGSVVLHERYFFNLGGDGKSAGEIRPALEHAFGGFDVWESEFRKIAMGLSGGSGWVVLAYNVHQAQLENYWAWDHMHNLPGSLPLLVLDMYEHAYQMDYGAQAAKYVDAFMANVNWEEVNRRFISTRKIAPLLHA
jgi:Fe-Mn family superoxide dismutase